MTAFHVNDGTSGNHYFGYPIRKILDPELPEQSWLQLTLAGSRLPPVTEMLLDFSFALKPKRIEKINGGKIIEFDVSGLIPLPDLLRSLPEKSKMEKLSLVEQVVNVLIEHHQRTGRSIGPIEEDYIFVDTSKVERPLHWLIMNIPTKPRTPNDDALVAHRLYEIAFPELRTIDIAKYKREVRTRLGISTEKSHESFRVFIGRLHRTSL